MSFWSEVVHVCRHAQRHARRYLLGMCRTPLENSAEAAKRTARLYSYGLYSYGQKDYRQVLTYARDMSSARRHRHSGHIAAVRRVVTTPTMLHIHTASPCACAYEQCTSEHHTVIILRVCEYHSVEISHAYEHRAPINTARLRVMRVYKHHAPMNTARLQTQHGYK